LNIEETFDENNLGMNHLKAPRDLRKDRGVTNK